MTIAPLDLKDLGILGSALVSAVVAHYRAIASIDRKMEIRDRELSDLKLSFVQTYITRSDVGEKLSDLKVSVTGMQARLDASFEKLDERLGRLEGRRRGDRS